MKRYEGCSGVSGWFISHLGWFIAGIFVLFFLILFFGNSIAQTNMNNGQNPVKLPQILEAREIGNMRIGDIGFAFISEMMVDEDGKCWLWKNGEIEDKHRKGRIKIERQKSGYYVYIFVTKENPLPKWVRNKIGQASRYTDLIPIFRIGIITSEANTGS